MAPWSFSKILDPESSSDQVFPLNPGTQPRCGSKKPHAHALCWAVVNLQMQTGSRKYNLYIWKEKNFRPYLSHKPSRFLQTTPAQKSPKDGRSQQWLVQQWKPRLPVGYPCPQHRKILTRAGVNKKLPCLSTESHIRHSRPIFSPMILGCFCTKNTKWSGCHGNHIHTEYLLSGPLQEAFCGPCQKSLQLQNITLCIL